MCPDSNKFHEEILDEKVDKLTKRRRTKVTGIHCIKEQSREKKFRLKKVPPQVCFLTNFLHFGYINLKISLRLMILIL